MEPIARTTRSMRSSPSGGEVYGGNNCRNIYIYFFGGGGVGLKEKCAQETRRNKIHHKAVNPVTKLGCKLEGRNLLPLKHNDRATRCAGPNCFLCIFFLALHVLFPLRENLYKYIYLYVPPPHLPAGHTLWVLPRWCPTSLRGAAESWTLLSPKVRNKWVTGPRHS